MAQRIAQLIVNTSPGVPVLPCSTTRSIRSPVGIPNTSTPPTTRPRSRRCVIERPSFTAVSAATRQQVRQALDAGFVSRRLDPRSLDDPEGAAQEIAVWAAGHLGPRPILVYSSAEPDEPFSCVYELSPSSASFVAKSLGLVAASRAVSSLILFA